MYRDAVKGNPIDAGNYNTQGLFNLGHPVILHKLQNSN
jgi:hypothetical protein